MSKEGTKTIHGNQTVASPSVLWGIGVVLIETVV